MYMENIFVCMAAPLLLAAWCLGKRQMRFLVFCLAGMAVCLLSAYFNTFFAAVYQANAFNATAEIAPVVEELMKLLPLLFYLAVFRPADEQVKAAALMVAVGFATFENICYLNRGGAEHLSFLLARGFGTGAMHIVCGVLVGCGLVYVWKYKWLKVAGFCGLVGAAITFHGVYNLLVTYGGAARYAAFVLPVATLIAGKAAGRLSAALSADGNA